MAKVEPRSSSSSRVHNTAAPPILRLRLRLELSRHDGLYHSKHQLAGPSPGSARVDVEPRFASETEDAPIGLDRRRSNGAEKTSNRRRGLAELLFSCPCFVLRPNLDLAGRAGRMSWPVARDFIRGVARAGTHETRDI